MAEMEYPPNQQPCLRAFFQENRPRESRRKPGASNKESANSLSGSQENARTAKGRQAVSWRKHLCRVISARTMARRKANLLFLCNEAIPRQQTYKQ